MRIILDGNDGTGKSTVFEKLRKLGLDVKDRGIPTKMTDDPALRPGDAEKGELYILLDVPVEVSRERLRAAGKDLTEKYHTVEDLTFYRKRYQEVAEVLGVDLIDSSGTPEETLTQVLQRVWPADEIVDTLPLSAIPTVDAYQGTRIIFATSTLPETFIMPHEKGQVVIPLVDNETSARAQVLKASPYTDELRVFRHRDGRVAVAALTFPESLEAIQG